MTEAFLAIKDKKDFECQNQESFQDCKMNEFLENGIQDCNCTPYNIRNYTRDVSTVFRLHYHTIPYLKVCLILIYQIRKVSVHMSISGWNVMQVLSQREDVPNNAKELMLI